MLEAISVVLGTVRGILEGKWIVLYAVSLNLDARDFVLETVSLDLETVSLNLERVRVEIWAGIGVLGWDEVAGGKRQGETPSVRPNSISQGQKSPYLFLKL